MALRLSPIWTRKIETGIYNYINNGVKFETTVDHRVTLAHVVYLLVTNNVPYRVIKHPGGVHVITTDVEKCDKCSGTGRC